jgi:hypothetical protein
MRATLALGARPRGLERTTAGVTYEPQPRIRERVLAWTQAMAPARVEPAHADTKSASNASFVGEMPQPTDVRDSPRDSLLALSGGYSARSMSPDLELKLLLIAARSLVASARVNPAGTGVKVSAFDRPARARRARHVRARDPASSFTGMIGSPINRTAGCTRRKRHGTGRTRSVF